MTKIDIVSGFLGAGKTTLIKKLLKEAYAGEKVVLVENEFGEIGIDGGFLREAGIEITEMNSGCICCSLVGDFEKALSEVLERFSPDRVLIEPSGVGKLSDVVGAVKKVLSDSVVLGSLITVADASKCKIYMQNFGEFYNNQIEHANAIVLSRTGGMNEEKLAAAVALLRAKNATAAIVTTPWDALDGAQILAAAKGNTLEDELRKLSETAEHEHHHHDHGEECHCHEHHHEHGEECHCHEHEQPHEHEPRLVDLGPGEQVPCRPHPHEHNHHADEVFETFGRETAKVYTKERVDAILQAFDTGVCGFVLRAKGILPGEDGKWIHFDYVPMEIDVRDGPPDVIGRLCFVGHHLHKDVIRELFDL